MSDLDFGEFAFQPTAISDTASDNLQKLYIRCVKIHRLVRVYHFSCRNFGKSLKIVMIVRY